MVIKGIDNGYGYTKDESFTLFKSAYTTEEPVSFYKGHKITINDTPYWVGIGAGTVDINKNNSEINKICTLTCLGLSKGTDFCIVAGLPINQYRQKKEEFKNIILSYSGSKVSVDDNTSKVIKIHNVAIYPQSISTIYDMNITDDVILVDIGYRTVDIALIQLDHNKPNIMLSDTYYSGMYSLYDKLSAVLNQKYELTLSAEDMEHLLNRGLYIHGVKQDISFLSDTLKQYFDKMFTQLILNYPTKTTDIILTGGGASFVHKAFIKRFPQTKVHKNNQFSNALGYYQIGRKLFS